MFKGISMVMCICKKVIASRAGVHYNYYHNLFLCGIRVYMVRQQALLSTSLNVHTTAAVDPHKVSQRPPPSHGCAETGETNLTP